MESPLGHLPALVSFGGHLIYGIFLGAIVGTFMKHRVLYVCKLPWIR
jgi:hypothetical protein